MPLTPSRESTLYQLAAARMAAATSNGERARIDRALDLVETVERTMTRDLWLVRSATAENRSYHVYRGACHCEDAQQRDPRGCKHTHAVHLYIALERAEADALAPPLLVVESLPQIPTYSDHPHGVLGALVEYLDPALYAEKFVPTITVESADEAIPYTPTGLRPPPSARRLAEAEAELFGDLPGQLYGV